MANRIACTYNEIHAMCERMSAEICAQFKPDLIIAIGGGGYIPARILRTFLRKDLNSRKNIPIQAIGLSLYEELDSAFLGEDEIKKGNVDESTKTFIPPVEQANQAVIRTQWLDFGSLNSSVLKGRNILIVDEVDDSRKTLEYALTELQKDTGDATQYAIFVLHNKQKEKIGKLPQDMFDRNRYFVAENTDDCWIDYPWEQSTAALVELDKRKYGLS